MKCAGTVAAAERRVIGLNDAALTNMVNIGVNQAVSATKFSIEITAASSVTASAASTIAYDTGWHVIECWWDLLGVYLSVDYESPIFVTSTSTHLPADGTTIYEEHGNLAGNGITYIDDTYLAMSR